MDDFDLERDLEDAGIDAFEFSLMDEDERREALEEAYLDPDMYMYADLDSGFDAWERLQSAGLSLSDLDFLDEDERRETLEAAGLDASDYEGVTGYYAPSHANQSSLPSSSQPNAAPPVKHESTVVPVGDDPNKPLTVYRYLQVRFSSGSPLYAYRTEDRTIHAGDRVVVPVGYQNELKCVVVVSSGDYTESTAPYPPDKTKFILRKATTADLAVVSERQKNTSTPTTKQAVNTETSRSKDDKKQVATGLHAESNNAGNERGKKRLLLTVIAVLSLIVIVLLVVLIRNFSAIQENYEARQEERAALQQEQQISRFLDLAAQYEEAAVDDILDEFSGTYRHKEFAEYENSLEVSIQSEIVSSGDQEDWVETIFLHVDADDIFDTYSDTARVVALYDYSVVAVNELHPDNRFYLPDSLRKAADTYGYRRIINCHLTIETSQNKYEYDYQAHPVKGRIASFDYFTLNGERYKVITPTPAPTTVPTPTPRPTATPRRTTSTPKPTSGSDPFNAQDYSHTDDFYYDYYDDFWDYEDAEDYWEEWND